MSTVFLNHGIVNFVQGLPSGKFVPVFIKLLSVVQHEDAENIGYVIPTPVMEHFINDYERNGQYTAFPALGIEWQKMESPFMRKALGMQVGAVIVSHCHRQSSSVCVHCAMTCQIHNSKTVKNRNSANDSNSESCSMLDRAADAHENNNRCSFPCMMM